MKKFLLITVFSVFIVTSGFVLWDDRDDFELLKNMEIFHNIMNQLRNYYVDDIDSRELITDAIDAMLAELDPYTVYYPESKVEEYRMLTESNYIGIGIETQYVNNRIYVVSVQEGYNADKAGLKVGDEIVEVNNISVSEIDVIGYNSLMKGDMGTYLDLKIKRNNEFIDFNIQRQKIDLETLSFSEKIDDFGYIRLESFSQTSASEFAKELNNLKSKKVKGLIIDLRDNPGGLLDQAVKIVNFFIPQNKLVVVAKGKSEEVNYSYMTKQKPVDLEIPIVILINNFSASASEIVSGALQDYDRAVLIGQRSFGKGLVQRIYNVGYNSNLKVTIAKYYIPSGRCVQEIDYKNHKIFTDTLTKFYTSKGRIVFEGAGITPDIAIKKNEEECLQLLEDSMYIYQFCNYYLNKMDTTTLKSVDDIDFNDFKMFLEFIDESSYYNNFPSIMFVKSMDDFVNEEIKEEKNNLIKSYKASIKESLIENKNQIKDMINKEIVLRLFYHKGYIKYSLIHDEEIKKAIEILKDTAKYTQILAN